MNLKIKHTFIAMLLGCAAHSQIITTFAGTGNVGYSPDGTAATAMSFSNQEYHGITADKQGNIYFLDKNELRRITKAGIVETIAGNNAISGLISGDGGPAANAILSSPAYVTLDRHANIYFTDNATAIIRRIDAVTGIITTISHAPRGPAICQGGDGGPVSQGSFVWVIGLAIDANDNIYVSDGQCSVVRKISPSGIITTFAGTGTVGFSGDGGPATNARFNVVGQVTFDNAGNVYIPDVYNNRIRKVAPNGIITTFAGTGVAGNAGNGGPASAAQLLLPYSLISDKNGNIYFNEMSCVRKIDPSGIITQYAGTTTLGFSGDGGLAINAKMYTGQVGMAINEDGEIFVTDVFNSRIRKISACPVVSFSNQPQSLQQCPSSNASFSVTAANATTLQWQVNNGSGWMNVTNIGVYSGATTSQLSISGVNTTMNGYLYRCMAGNVCGALASDPATLTINPSVTPGVTIAIPPAAICAGTSVTFTATSVNGGSAPTYQWRKNGVIMADSNSPQYTDNTLVTGDEVVCVMTSNEKCLTQTFAVSNPITITANPVSSPTITVLASANNICKGTTINFTATTQGLAGNPFYQWKKNGLDVGTNTPAYSDNTLNNDDIISCSLSSDYGCQLTPLIESNKETIKIVSPQTPVATISTNSTTNCLNGTVHFLATGTNTGSVVSYQWQKNGVTVGTDDFKYADNNLSNGDIITCSIFTTNGCLATNSAVSNALVMTNYPIPVPALDKTPTICTGGTRTLDAGDFKTYLWDDGSSSRTRVVNSTGQYSVTVTDQHGCAGTDGMTISQTLPAPSGFMPADTTICNYGTLVLNAAPGYQDYHWSNNSRTRSTQISGPGTYTLEVTDQDQCKGTETVHVSLKQCMEGFYLPAAFTPNNDGKNDIFRPFVFGDLTLYRFTVYNRSGQIVFQTTDPTKGWDGKLKGTAQATNVFVWTCSYQLRGASLKTERGSVTLIR